MGGKDVLEQGQAGCPWLLCSGHGLFLPPWAPGQVQRAGSRTRHWGIASRRVQPYLVGSDERLHSQVVLHQLVHVGLRVHQRLRSCHGRQGA